MQCVAIGAPGALVLTALVVAVLVVYALGYWKGARDTMIEAKRAIDRVASAAARGEVRS